MSSSSSYWHRGSWANSVMSWTTLPSVLLCCTQGPLSWVSRETWSRNPGNLHWRLWYSLDCPFNAAVPRLGSLTPLACPLIPQTAPVFAQNKRLGYRDHIASDMCALYQVDTFDLSTQKCEPFLENGFRSLASTCAHILDEIGACSQLVCRYVSFLYHLDR